MTKQKHTGEENFQRYLENKMNGRERNAYEKELQKNPFEDEALEGLSAFENETISADIDELRTKLSPLRRRSNLRYWVAAASFLLVAATGVLFYLVTEKPPVQQVAETQEPQPEPKQEEAAIQQEKEQDISEKGKIASPVAKSPQKGKGETGAGLIMEAEAEDSEFIEESDSFLDENKTLPDSDITVKKAFEQEAANGIQLSSLEQEEKPLRFIQTTGEKPTGVVRGIVISTDGNEPVPGATVLIKGTSKGTVTDNQGKFEIEGVTDSSQTFVASFIGMENTEFHLRKDSETIVKIEPSALALDEVVVIGYGSKKKAHVTGSVSKVENKKIKLQPVGGYEAYKNYLDEKCKIPQGYNPGKKVVKVRIAIGAAGKVDSVAALNSPDPVLFKKAEEILQNGPHWILATEPDRQRGTEVILKLNFKP